MAKPAWKAASQTPLFDVEGIPTGKMRPICANCGWRLAKVVHGERAREATALPWCGECEAEHGGQRGPAPTRLPELPTKKKNVDTVKVKDRLAAIGAIPVTCKACGWSGHTSTDCPSRPGVEAAT